MSKPYKYLFGPVPSRRLGLSLGVDLTPYKTCSFDCIFCQLGRTTNKTVKRKEYVPTPAVTEELHDWLENDGHADFITLAGSGEPTLHSSFGDVIDSVKSVKTFPVALLTNGSLLGEALAPNVVQAVKQHIDPQAINILDASPGTACPVVKALDGADVGAIETEQAVANSNAAAGGGTGIQSAQLVADKDAKTVLTGNCGPNAFRTLEAAGIEVVVGAAGTVREAVEAYKAGNMKATGGPNVESHAGMK